MGPNLKDPEPTGSGKFIFGHDWLQIIIENLRSSLKRSGENYPPSRLNGNGSVKCATGVDCLKTIIISSGPDQYQERSELAPNRTTIAKYQTQKNHKQTKISV